jgi:hypothetical protein
LARWKNVRFGRATGYDMIKAVILFLLVMVAIGMVGNALFPGSVRRRLSRSKPKTCPRCGRYVIGSKGCDCKKG